MKCLYCVILACILAGWSCSADPHGKARFPEDREPNEVRIVLKSEPPTLNPLLSTQSMTRYVAEHIFQTLNHQNAVTYELNPALASLPVVETFPDGHLSYTYQLDSLARWPNGSRVTATDVIFSLKALLNPFVDAGAYRSYYKMISGVEVLSPDSLAFRILTEQPYFLTAQALGDLYVYPRYAYDPDNLLGGVPLADLTREEAGPLTKWEEPMRQFADDFNRPARGYDPALIVGSGPYELRQWEAGQRIQLQLREDYWGQHRTEDFMVGLPEMLSFEIMSDNVTTANALRDQLVDVVVDMPTAQYLQLREEDYLASLYDFVSVPSLRYYSILLNQDDPLLEDSLTRKALAHLVDVDRIVERFFPNLAQRVTGPVLPSKSYYNADLSPLAYDPDLARDLLAQAGWEDSDGDNILDREVKGETQVLQFTLLSYPNPASEGVTILLQEAAREVGIDIQVQKQEGRTLLDRLDEGRFTASFYGLGFEPSPDDFSQLWASTAVPPRGNNRGNFTNAEADTLIRQIAATTDSAARAPLYRRFQEIVYENQPMIFLYSPRATLVVSKRLDYKLNSIAPHLYFNALRVRPTS